MSGHLLDTNVVSEMVRSVPHPRVAGFFLEHDDLWLSAIVVHELEYGVRRLPQGRRRTGLIGKLSRLIREYDDRVLPLDRAGAEWAAQFRAHTQRSGLTLDVGDALIAGTAKARGLALVTRNVADFESLDIDIVNPWETL